MSLTENAAFTDGRLSYRKRRRVLISCTECHRRKQKCDRHRPCQNCKKRCKPDSCYYQSNDSNISDSSAALACSANFSENSVASPPSHTSSQPPAKTDRVSSQDYGHLVNILGYSAHNMHSTFALVNQVGAHNACKPRPADSGDPSDRTQIALNDKYLSLIRQLPSKEYIDSLVQQFFSEINWQYDVLDEITFRQQLESWRRHPYLAHSRAADSLHVDIIAFPSLLSQVLAHALLHHHAGEQESSILDSLKYIPEMTFMDLACEFSEFGYSIIGMMKKTTLSMVAVQSGILRASFLKNTGSVIEAWHVVGTAVRNAQEIGLHANATKLDSSACVDAQWDHEMRRRIWFVLYNWDIHMAVVLGRPIMTITAPGIVELPDEIAQRRCGMPPQKRTDHDPPTPLSVIRIGFETAYRYFPQVRDLENRGARTEDYHMVRETHAAIVRNMAQIPQWCRLNAQDVRFDDALGCLWLPAARPSLASGTHFVLLSLHRPYMFSVRESRTEALNAARAILSAQKQLFPLSKPKRFMEFNMIYPLFDALVIALSILVLFPNENADFRSQLVEEAEWSFDILDKVGQQNGMARSATGVLKTLISRLEEVYGYRFHRPLRDSEERPAKNVPSNDVDMCATGNNSYTGSVIDSLSSSSIIRPLLPAPSQETSTALEIPNFDFETLLPPHPVGDLFYQNAYAPDTSPGAGIQPELAQFDDTDDGFWSFISHL